MPDSRANTAAEVAPMRGSAARMYGVVMGVGIVCSLAIVGVYETTRPIILRKTRERRHQAILQVLPAASTITPFRRNERGEFEASTASDGDAELVYAGYDRDHRLVGLAIESQGMGYQDVLRVLYGYSFDQQAITGICVLQSQETPGLGDRIETDADYLRNFRALDVRVTPTGDRLVHAIEFVKPGQKQTAWQVDGIAGATITSRAVAHMLRESSEKWIPQVHQRRADFQFARHKE